MTLLSLGKIVGTPGALSALAEAGLSPDFLINKHIQGDWGDVGREDWEANQQALKDGSRILSVYQISPTVRVWIITEGMNDSGVRESTCLLLPSEY